MDKLELKKISNKVRQGIIESTNLAKSGHPGGALSATECIVYLYFEEMNIDPANPLWEDRDRFVLSKGHSVPCQYATMAYRGFFPVEELKTLRQVGSRLQGHPCMQYLPGIDMSTGSLGQGFSAACGMAMSAKIRGKDYRVYSVLGDGEIEEGIVWEAAMFAGNRRLDNLVAVIDSNRLQLDGFCKDINPPYPIGKKFEAFNFEVIEVEDGHDFDQLAEAFKKARKVKGKPVCIIINTIKGKGVSFMENSPDWHGKSTNPEEYKQAMEELTKAGEELCRM